MKLIFLLIIPYVLRELEAEKKLLFIGLPFSLILTVALLGRYYQRLMIRKLETQKSL